MNDHFGSGDAQTHSINDEAEPPEQVDDVDEEERDDPPDREKNESRPLFLTHCRYVDKSVIKCCLNSPPHNMYI